MPLHLSPFLLHPYAIESVSTSFLAVLSNSSTASRAYPRSSRKRLNCNPLHAPSYPSTSSASATPNRLLLPAMLSGAQAPLAEVFSPIPCDLRFSNLCRSPSCLFHSCPPQCLLLRLPAFVCSLEPVHHPSHPPGGPNSTHEANPDMATINLALGRSCRVRGSCSGKMKLYREKWQSHDVGSRRERRWMRRARRMIFYSVELSEARWPFQTQCREMRCGQRLGRRLTRKL